MAHFEITLAELKAAGAEIVDPFAVPEIDPIQRGPARPGSKMTSRNGSRSIPGPISVGPGDCRLQTRAPPSPGLSRRAAAAKPVDDDPETIEALKNEQRYRDGFTAAMDAGQIDAMVFPTWAQLPAMNGDRNTQLVAEPSPHLTLDPQRQWPHIRRSALQWPALSVPSGFLGESLPQGLQILGRPWDDAKIIGYAYAYEQATHYRRPPATVPPLANVRDAERRGRMKRRERLARIRLTRARRRTSLLIVASVGSTFVST